jgi:peptidoglycan/LPS O-acetylase OafA/YrhL
MESKKERNSSIELLKIIAMFMIVISHLAQSYGTLHTNLPVAQEYFYDLKIASANINNIIMILLRSLGAIGNDIFFICTAWFLVDSKKSNKKKVIEMLLDVWAINIAILLILKNGGGKCW